MGKALHHKLSLSAVLFALVCSAWGVQAQTNISGIFESYLILDLGSGNAFYDLQAATANPDYTGSLGSFVQCTGTLTLRGAQNKTFKCPSCDITNGALFYRVYPQGGTPGTFTSLNLPFLSNDPGATCPGGQNQTWQENTASVNLLSGRAPGVYVLEVYTAANFQGCGTGTHLADNGGAYYSATFTVTGGATCPVFVMSSGGTGFATYSTLKGAFDAVNAGTHTGTIAITIGANTTETATAVLNASGSGSASYSAITIQPGGGAAVTVSGAITAGSPLIDFNGADNVTVNGLNTGGNSLTIANTTVSATSGTSTIRFIGGATNNTITNCNVQGSGTMSVATNGAVIFFSTDGNTTNGNDNNTISNCNIGPAGSNLPTKGILGNGSTTTTAIGNGGIVIDNNNIFDYFGAAVTSAGVAINGGCNTWTITNNRFYQTATRTWTTGAEHNAILLNSSTSTSGVQGMTITGNTIGYASNTQTGTYTLTGSTGIFRAIRFNGITGGTLSSISNNTIAAVSLTGVTSSGTGTSSPFSAIIINNGLVNTNSNTIGSQTATGSLTFSTNTTTATDVHGIFCFASDNWTSNSNSIGGITANNAGASGAFIVYGLRSNMGTTYNWNASSNLVGGSIPNSIQNNSTSTTAQLIGMASSSTFSSICNFNQNTVRNLTAAGGTGTTVSASVIGMQFAVATPNHTISQNTIHSLTNTNTTAATVVTGIQFTGGSANVVERNLIYGLTSATNSASAEINGIRIAGGTSVYRNNMIILGAGVSNAIGAVAANSSTSGIVGINEALGTNSIWHNSIYIGGTATAGSGSSYAFNGVQTLNTRSFRNNIFFNARTNSGATGKHYALKINGTTPNPSGLTIDNNIYYVNGTGGVLGFFNSADVASLGDWQTAVGQDAGSLSADPLFVSASDLHLTTNSPAEAAGFLIASVTDDFDGETRAGLTPVDIGADAGNYGVLCSGMPTAGTISSVPTSICVSGSAVLTLDGATTGNGITYQWKEAATPGGPYTNVGTNAATYTTGTITSPRYYVVDVTCSNGPNTATTAEYTLAVNPLPTVSVNPTSGLICNPGGTAVALTASGASTYSWSPATGLDMTTGSTVNANPTATTTYTVTGTDANGCQNTAMVTVTVADKPAIEAITATPSTICSGDNSQLNVNAGLVTTTANGGAITINSSGSATPYPSTINVSGLPASGVKVKQVLINGLSHTFPSDIDMLLQSPTATNVVLISDQGGSNTISNVNLVFQDGSPAIGTTIVSGTFRPTVDTGSDTYPAPGPGTVTPPSIPTLSSFTGNLNGTWNLFVVDDASGDAGSITSWSIVFEYGAAVTSYSWSPNTFLNDANVANPLASNVTATTTYTVTATAASGCFATADVTVNVIPTPTATVSGGGTVCSTDPLPDVSFALTGTGPWDLTYNDGTNNIVVMGIASSPYTISNAPAGTYTVVSVSDANCPGMGSGSVTVAVTPATTWYQDSDGDSYGNAAVSQMACSQPTGYVADNTDCDDNNNDINPATVWYKDEDSDGYSDGATLTQCTQPSNYYLAGVLTATSGDCDDTEPAKFPGNPEICDGIDNNCNGLTDAADPALVDNILPTVSCSNQAITFSGQSSITLDAGAFVTASDNCGIQSIVLSPSVISCTQVGQVVPVTATVTDFKGNVATCTSQITVSGLPCGWNQQANGINCVNGSSVSFQPASGTWTVTSTNCYYPGGTSDQMAFAQRTLCGDGSITAQVTSMSGAGWAGIIMRESNAAGAKKVQLMTNLASNLSRREIRTTTNGMANIQQFPAQNRFWLRIVRQGSQFTGFHSVDGIQWTFIFATNMTMNACLEIGLAVTNYNAIGSVTATFANVSTTGTGINNLSAGTGSQAPGAVSTEEPVRYDFGMHPNPTSGALHIDLAGYAGKAVRVEFYSMEGRLMSFREIDEVQTTTEQFDLSSYPNGVYLVKVSSSGLPATAKRLVLQRN